MPIIEKPEGGNTIYQTDQNKLIVVIGKNITVIDTKDVLVVFQGKECE